MLSVEVIHAACIKHKLLVPSLRFHLLLFVFFVVCIFAIFLCIFLVLFAFLWIEKQRFVCKFLDNSAVVFDTHAILFFFRHHRCTFDFIIAGHLLTVNVDWSISLHKFERYWCIRKFQNCLHWTIFAGFEYGNWYFYSFTDCWRFNLQTRKIC